MMRDLLLKKWAQVRTGLLDTIAKFEDAELGYRPFDKAYSAGELMLHVAHAEDIEVRYALLLSSRSYRRPMLRQAMRTKRPSSPSLRHLTPPRSLTGRASTITKSWLKSSCPGARPRVVSTCSGTSWSTRCIIARSSR